MEKHRRDESPSGLSDIIEQDGLLGTGLTVGQFPCLCLPAIADSAVMAFSSPGISKPLDVRLPPQPDI